MDSLASTSRRVIYCDGGLGNRLNGLIVPLALARGTTFQTTILWPRTKWCDAGFGDLFRGEVDVLELHVAQILSQLSDNGFIDLNHRSADEISARLFPIAHDSLPDLEGYRRLWEDPAKRILYRHCLIPSCLDDLWFLTRGMAQFSPRPDIVEAVEAFCKVFQIDSSVTGVHYRGTDYGLRLQEVDLLRRLISSNRDKRFYICSDEPSVVAALSAEDNVVQTNDTSFGGFHAKLGTVIHGGEIFRTKDSVYLALIEMLILSRTTILETSNSTFLRFAQLLSRARGSGLEGW